MSNKTDNKIKQVFISSGEQRILEYLSFVDEWKTVQEIKKASQLSKAAIHLILDKLFKLNLLERDQKGKSYLYRVNSSSNFFCILSQFKVLNNLINIFKQNYNGVGCGGAPTLGLILIVIVSESV